MLKGGSAKMRSANGSSTLHSFFMQSPQVILLRSFCITIYYMFLAGMQGDLGAGVVVLNARSAEICR